MGRVKVGNVYPSDEYLLQRCAPAGFGLGYATLLTANDNLNSIKKNGWYHWKSEAAPANAPTMSYTTYMNVMRVWTNDGGVCCQELMDMSDSTIRGTKIQRIIYGPNVFPWEWVNPPMISGIEYCTTERYMSKPVYAKLVNVGAYPESGLRNVDTGIVATGIVRFHAASGCYTLPIADNMEINIQQSSGKLEVQLNTKGERITANDIYVTLYYIKD